MSPSHARVGSTFVLLLRVRGEQCERPLNYTIKKRTWRYIEFGIARLVIRSDCTRGEYKQEKREL